MNDATETARAIAEIASDALASDITILDVRGRSSLTDVLVIGSADNVRQLNALRERVLRELRESGTRPRRVEGSAESGWVLIDYGDVIVHLMTLDLREFYRLEDLWTEAPVLLKIQ